MYNKFYRWLVKFLAKIIIYGRKIFRFIKKYDEDFLNFSVILVSLFAFKIFSNLEEIKTILSISGQEILKSTVKLSFTTVFFTILLIAILKGFDKNTFYIITKIFLSVVCVKLISSKILLYILLILIPYIFDFIKDVYEQYFEERKVSV